MIVGIVPADKASLSGEAAFEIGYTYHANDFGYVLGRCHRKDTRGFKPGDSMTVIVDLNESTVTFARNGTPLGWHENIRHQAYNFAFDSFYIGDEATIMDWM